MEETLQTGEPAVLTGCIESMEKSRALVEALTDEQFTRQVAGHRSISQHMAHNLAHVAALIDGIDGEFIDYSTHTEHEDTMTRDKALERIDELRASLKKIGRSDLVDGVDAHLVVDDDGTVEELTSTVEREVAYLGSHMIHHLALMHMLATIQGVELEADMADAFARLPHHRT